MTEPIRVGGHWKCPQCGESYHSSIVHECGANDRYADQIAKQIAEAMSPPASTTLDELTTLVDASLRARAMLSRLQGASARIFEGSNTTYAEQESVALEALEAARTALLTRLSSIVEERSQHIANIAERRERIIVLHAERQRLEEALRRLLSSGIVLDDSRLDYVVVHVDRSDCKEAVALLSPSGPLTAPKVWEQPPYVDGEAVPCHLCGASVFVKRDGTYRERVAPAVDGDIHDCRAAPSAASVPTPATLRHNWLPRTKGDARRQTPDGYSRCTECGKPYPLSVATGEVGEPCPGKSSTPTHRRDEAEGLVRLIVESFRDAPNPSVDIAVEEIMMTFNPPSSSERP